MNTDKLQECQQAVLQINICFCCSDLDFLKLGKWPTSTQEKGANGAVLNGILAKNLIVVNAYFTLNRVAFF